mmetsp:Transcript_12262/g.35996  ORF Transcript_12262/g.35996 Transcript_12262/m.35996 type:complete len:171 (-) Transcript_12262:1354-1866(-)
MSATRLLGGAGALAALGYGGYYAVQSQEVGKAEKSLAQAVGLVDSEQRKLKSCTKALGESEAKQGELTRAYEEAAKAVQDGEVELEAARAALAELEAAHAKKQDKAHRVATDIQGLKSRILALKQDIERSSEATTMGEKSIKIARQEALEARKLYNPLNHPKVKAMLGGK